MFLSWICKTVPSFLTTSLLEIIIPKSDTNTGKVRCEVANHLLNVCHSEGNKFEYLQIQLMEQVSVNNSKNIDKMLWERVKYWQAQLFTLTHGLNSTNEWYAQNRRGCSK